MKTPKVFKVTAIESFFAVGEDDPQKPNIHIFEEPMTGENHDAMEFQVKRTLSEGMDDEQAQSFFGRLEVKVEAVNFPG